MRPLGSGDGKSRAARRPVAPHGSQPGITNTRTPSRRHHRTAITPPTCSITNRISFLQHRAAVVANMVADIAWASDDRAWAEAASHLLSATCSLWLAAEALAEWGMVA
jgi:hypothetical protein